MGLSTVVDEQSKVSLPTRISGGREAGRSRRTDDRFRRATPPRRRPVWQNTRCPAPSVPSRNNGPRHAIEHWVSGHAPGAIATPDFVRCCMARRFGFRWGSEFGVVGSVGGRPTESWRCRVFDVDQVGASDLRASSGHGCFVCVFGSPRLGLADREVISRGLAADRSARSIAVELGRPVSTVTREINRNGGRQDIGRIAAHADTCVRARRPRPTVFERNPVLAGVVEDWLENQQWSPRQISARLRVEFPDDETMRVAPETIYQGLYVYGRGGLRKELSAHLRSRRDARRPHR